MLVTVSAAQVQQTTRYIQVPSQLRVLQLPGGQSLSLRIGGWSFARSPAQLPVLCVSLRVGGWSFARSPAQLPVLCVSLRIGGWSFARSPAQLPVLVVSLRIGGRGFGRNSASATSSV